MSRRYGEKDLQDAQSCRWPTALYLRISKEDGNNESYSIANQRRWLENYAADQGDLELVRCYVDDGVSGTSEEERPAYRQMLQDIMAGEIKCVLVKDLSRPFRNSADQTRFLEETRVRYGVRFISTRMQFVDTHKHPETLNMLAIGFQGMMNENHCRETSLKIRDVFDIKRKNGLFIGAFAPYGYAKNPQDKNRLVVDEEAAAVVRDIFHWFWGGMSKEGITKRLNELGIPNPAAYKRSKGQKYHNPHGGDSPLWTQRTVYHMLSNQVYIGHMVQGRQRVKSYKVHERVNLPQEQWYIVENTHQPIIGPQMFDEVQELMNRDMRTPPAKGEVHLFAGLVRCADCKRAMHRKTSKSIAYYHCRTYARQSKTSCTKHTIREDLLYRIVLEAVQGQIKMFPNPAGLVKRIQEAASMNSREHGLHTLLERHREALGKKRAQSKTLYKDMKDGLLSREEYMDLKGELRDEAAALEKLVEKLEGECRAKEGDAGANHPELAHFQEFGTVKALDRRLLLELLSEVLVHEDGQVELIFKLEDPFQKQADCRENPHREAQSPGQKASSGAAQ